MIPTPVEIVAEARRRGIVLSAVAGKLRCDAPAGALDSDLKAALTAHKPAVLALVLRDRLDAPDWRQRLARSSGTFVDDAGPALPDPPIVEPADPNLAAALASWPPEWRAAWDERAGIMEFDGGMSRPEAELAAYHSYKGCIK